MTCRSQVVVCAYACRSQVTESLRSLWRPASVPDELLQCEHRVTCINKIESSIFRHGGFPYNDVVEADGQPGTACMFGTHIEAKSLCYAPNGATSTDRPVRLCGGIRIVEVKAEKRQKMFWKKGEKRGLHPIFFAVSSARECPGQYRTAAPHRSTVTLLPSEPRDTRTRSNCISASPTIIGTICTRSKFMWAIGFLRKLAFR
ncbi:hypothetical protein B0T21DRAFT_419624 [Apiosordaria backusii]|uniref:Uncharacterized protein n=1 Tax=Apiosordaria backusii TaxID=314023 RepID=A0AA40K7D6_9PEZI|nr:hypothetical protein B0T21DRAFT_419624 [Apiosordaria backusii]